MNKTISEQLKSVRSTFIFWRKAFDSKENKVIFIRRARAHFYTGSDIWEVRGSAERLYSVPGTIPLYVTMVE